MTDDKQDKPSGVVILIALGFFFYSPYVEGWVLAHLWQWYAVPLGLRAIGWKAFAAADLAIVLLRQYPQTSKLTQSDYVSRLTLSFLLPWIVLLIGWLPL